MDFANAYAQGFARVAACTFPLTVADPADNAAAIISQARAAHAEQVGIAVFPELALSGYAIDDLHLQDTLLDAVLAGLGQIVAASQELLPVLVVGAPLVHLDRVVNAAVVIHRGQVLGVSGKSYLPNYREFYERRWFAPVDDRSGSSITLPGVTGTDQVPFGPDLLFTATDLPGLTMHVEICEDMWVPIPPSAEASLAGATVLANLSGSPITIGRADDRRLLVHSASARCNAAYVYAAAGSGESTTDLSWDGQTLIYEAGELLAEGERFLESPVLTLADVDLDRLRQERIRQGTHDDNRRTHADRTSRFRRIDFTLAPPAGDLGLRRSLDRFPFVPDDPQRLAQDCYEAYNIQVSGLEKRLRAISTDTFQPKVMIGVSGGLDSTHALIVAAKAMDRLGRPRSDIHAFTMPGFATGETTKSYATRLATSLDVRFEELDITSAARQMLADMDHPFAEGQEVYDVTFENVQAGLRTDYLFRLANHRGGIVLGTGDMSELALGWCTYGVGDQMSHYNVNGGVPKTLIQHLIRWVIESGQFGSDTATVLAEIVEQEITPELIPGGSQSTEASVGPYSLQDFSLYHVVRRGYRPRKIAFLAWHAWSDAERGEWPVGLPESRRVSYDLATVREWLQVFTKRFFANQFKRSALPNGPKVSAGGTMSPRGDWRMPSDASAAAWLAEIDRDIPATEPDSPTNYRG